MATATVAITVTNLDSTWSDGKMYHVYGTLTLTASPATYLTGGLPVNFASPLIKATRAPKIVNLNSQNGYIYSYVPGTDNTNGLLKIFTAIGTELGNAVAIPAGNSGDVIQFEAIFLGQN